MQTCARLLLILAVPFVALAAELDAPDPPASLMPASVNISFVKEITLSISPPELGDFALDSPQSKAGVVQDFLESSLRLFDPLMTFLQSYFVEPPAPIHADNSSSSV